MPAAYSTDIRGRVIASVESRSSRREAAEEFDVSASSAIKWVATYRTTGSCAAKPRGGSTSPLEKYANFLLTLIEGQPDLTLDEVVSAMRKHKIPGSRTAVWRFFQRHKITFKKNVWRAPFASGFRRHGLTSLLQRIRSRDQFSRPRWRSAHPGPNKPCRRRCAIFLTRVPECRSTVRPSRFPPPANLRRSISA